MIVTGAAQQGASTDAAFFRSAPEGCAAELERYARRWFATIQATGRVDFSKPITFSYIFTCGKGAEVNALCTRLEPDGFEFVEAYVDTGGRTRLEVVRKDVRSPGPMVERNRQFRSFGSSNTA